MTAEELKTFGVIDRVIPEREPADVDHMEELAGQLRREIQNFLERSDGKSQEEILQERYEKFRNPGKRTVLSRRRT